MAPTETGAAWAKAMIGHLKPSPHGHRVKLTSEALLRRPNDGIGLPIRWGSPVGKLPFEPDQSRNPPWRTIRLDVTPAALRAYWRDGEAGDRLIAVVPRERMAAVAGDLAIEFRSRNLTLTPTPPPTASPVGVFAHNGTVSMRNVTLEPLTP